MLTEIHKQANALDLYNNIGSSLNKTKVRQIDQLARTHWVNLPQFSVRATVQIIGQSLTVTYIVSNPELDIYRNNRTIKLINLLNTGIRTVHAYFRAALNHSNLN